MTTHHGTHNDLHSEQGALRGEHPGRATNPTIKVADLAWLEFQKPDLAGSERFAHAFGFTTVSRTADELQLRGTDSGAPCVIVRRGPRSTYLGAAFRAAEPTDVLRLADATGAEVSKLPESLGGITVDLTDPSGVLVRVVNGTHELSALPSQPAQTVNAGHEVARSNATQRPPREPAKVQRLGHVVLQSTTYIQTLNWYLQHLGLIVSDFKYLPGPARAWPHHELHPLRPRLDPDGPPHAGDDARSAEPLRALGVPGRGHRRDGRRWRVPPGAWLPPLLGDRPAHRGQPDLRLLARPRRPAGRALHRRRPV